MTGGVFVCVATLASRTAWLAAVAMAVVGFGVIFAGVVSSVLAGATTALLLAFILPVSLAAPASAVPAGWPAGGWPQASRWSRRRCCGPRRRATGCVVPRPRRAGRWPPGWVRGSGTCSAGWTDTVRGTAITRLARADQAVGALRSTFLATPYRPTGLNTPARTTVRLVDELIWLNSILIQPGLHRDGVRRAALRVNQAAAAVLDRAADLLGSRGGSSDELDAALTQLAAAHAEMQEGRDGRPGAGDQPCRPGRGR